MHVGNTNFNFVTENLRIIKIFPMKITMLKKMKFSSSLFTKMNGSPRTCMNRRYDWLLKTIKDNKTVEV